jgi:hypothetical protein
MAVPRTMMMTMTETVMRMVAMARRATSHLLLRINPLSGVPRSLLAREMDLARRRLRRLVKEKGVCPRMSLRRARETGVCHGMPLVPPQVFLPLLLMR